MRDIDWFNEGYSQLFHNFELQYQYFPNGEFGSLNQIEFNSNEYGGNIDFWGNGWIGIFVWDYQNDIEIMNFLYDNEQEQEINEAFMKLRKLFT